MPASSADSSPTNTKGETLPRRSPSRVRFTDFQFTPLNVSAAAQNDRHHRSGSSTPTQHSFEDYDSVQAGLVSDPGTPNIAEARARIRRTLSLASLDTLLSLTSTVRSDTREVSVAVESMTRTRHATHSVDLLRQQEEEEQSSVSALGLSIPSGSMYSSTSITVSPVPLSPAARSSSDPLIDAAAYLSSPLLRLPPTDPARQQERARLIAQRRDEARELLRDLGGLVWRPEGEGERKPGDWERVLVLTVKKTIRTYLPSFGF